MKIVEANSEMLLFVRGNTEVEKQDTGKHDWAVFLSTDVNLEAAKVLEIYALRTTSFAENPGNVALAK
jgi:hypothetical protein